MATRKDQLREQIEAAERTAERAGRELARLEALPDFSQAAEGDVLAILVEWPGGRRSYTYVVIKAGGRWFVTGQAGGKGDEELTEFLVANRRNVVDIKYLATVLTGPVETMDLGAFMSLILAPGSGAANRD